MTSMTFLKVGMSFIKKESWLYFQCTFHVLIRDGLQLQNKSTLGKMRYTSFW